MTSGISDLISTFKGVVSKVTSALSGIGDAIAAPFIAGFNAVKGAIESVVKWITDKVDALKSAVSGGIDLVKSTYNKMARTWNAIEIKLPEVKVPLGPTLGGQTIGLPDLPLLANGAYVTRATAAIIGERGSEIVAPEAMLRAIMREEAGETSSSYSTSPHRQPHRDGPSGGLRAPLLLCGRRPLGGASMTTTLPKPLIDMEVCLGVGQSDMAGVWDSAAWDVNTWSQTDTSLGDWVDVTCEVLDGFELGAGATSVDGVVTRWEAATCALTLKGAQFNPRTGPYAGLMGPGLPIRVRWRPAGLGARRYS